MPEYAALLATIADEARAVLDAADEARESAYRLQREVTRAAATAIRAVHRHESDESERRLAECGALCVELNAAARRAQSVYWSGFVLDAQKEYAEAALLIALTADREPPTPSDLDIETAPWLNGLAEAGGELRRFTLDALKNGDHQRAQNSLARLGEIYDLLVGFDYPDALLLGLKRRLDMVRAAFERTTSDVLTTLREAELTAALNRVAPITDDR
jgi:translin